MLYVRKSIVFDVLIDEVWVVICDFNGYDKWYLVVVESYIECSYLLDWVGCVCNFCLEDDVNLWE